MYFDVLGSPRRLGGFLLLVLYGKLIIFLCKSTIYRVLLLWLVIISLG